MIASTMLSKLVVAVMMPKGHIDYLAAERLKQTSTQFPGRGFKNVS